MSVTFAVQDGCVRVTVRDDGRGFNPRAVSSDAESRVGLRVMRERAAEVGGECVMQSAPDQGTQVIVTVPVRA